MEKKNKTEKVPRKFYKYGIPKKIFLKGIENNNYLINYLFITTHRSLSDILTFTKKQLFEFHKVSNAQNKKQVILDMQISLKEFGRNYNDKNIDLNVYGLNDLITIELDMFETEFCIPFGLLDNYELKILNSYDGKKVGFGKLLLVFLRHKVIMYKRSNPNEMPETIPEISYFYKNHLAEELHIARGTIESSIKLLEDLKLIKTTTGKFIKTYDGVIHKGETIVADYYSNNKNSSAELELACGVKYLERQFLEKDKERRINKEKKFLKKNKEI